MKIEIPWGDQFLPLTLPDTWNIIEPDMASIPLSDNDEEFIVQKSLDAPINRKRLDIQNLKDKKVLIVVDDNTRPTPVEAILTPVMAQLKRAGVKKMDIHIITALGSHTPMTENEVIERCGRKNIKGVSWENHDAFSPDTCSYFGTTSRGTEVYLNRKIEEADLIISIGTIEPHIWAGFGGGLKNILPGLASSATIGQHYEIITRPPYRFNRVGMPSSKNSFRLDLEEIEAMIQGDIFICNVLLDHNGTIIGAVSGDPIMAHREGIQLNRRWSAISIERQFDAVIVNSHPMDINFKQSMTCVDNFIPAVKPGGIIMGFLRAERGMDDIIPPDDKKPLWVVKMILRILGPSRVFWFLNKVRKNLNVEEKFLVYYSMQVMREFDLFFYVPTVSEEEVTRLGFFKNFSDPQDVINRAARKLTKNATVGIFPRGGTTFPEVYRDPFFPLK
jgi:lactate racemase